MGDEIENPIGEVMRGGISAISAFIRNGGLLNIVVWMALVYIKTHLKDRIYKFRLDERVGGAKISDAYDWNHIYHAHVIARCFFTGCAIERSALGSFFCLPADIDSAFEAFDFADLYFAQTVMLRLGDAAVFCVFNDFGSAADILSEKMARIDGPLSPIQLREIMVELAFLNLSLKQRAIFRTECDPKLQTCKISGTYPQIDLVPLDLRFKGKLLRQALEDIPQQIQFDGATRDEVSAAIDSGTMTFLFDEDGNFIRNSMKLVRDPGSGD